MNINNTEKLHSRGSMIFLQHGILYFRKTRVNAVKSPWAVMALSIDQVMVPYQKSYKSRYGTQAVSWAFWRGAEGGAGDNV